MAISLTLFALFSCQNRTPIYSENVIIDDLNLQNAINQNQNIEKAIIKFERGQFLEAEKLVNQVLKFNPQHKTAKLLKRQLTIPMDKLFNTTRLTTYKIGVGDTLGSIAKTWFGNSLYFVSLARFNQIKNPSQLTLGRSLRIPVTSSNPLTIKEARRSNANLKLLNSYINKKHFIKSLRRMSDIYIIAKHNNDLIGLQKEALEGLAESRVSISERYRMIDQVRVLSANSKRKFLDKQFQSFFKQELSNVLVDEFILLFEDNSYQSAADKLIQAKKVKLAALQGTKAFRIEKLLVNKLHEEAIVFRKNQQLEKAASSWKKILQIQPNNELAIKYYKRTKQLLEHLNKL